MARSEHHEPHNAFAIDFLAVFLDSDVRGEFTRSFDKLGGRPGVDAKLVSNSEFAGRSRGLSQDERIIAASGGRREGKISTEN